MNNNNAWVKFKIQNAYNSGLLSESVACDFVEIVDKFKNRNFYFSMPGDFDDRFSETLKNIFEFFYNKEVEVYAKEKGINLEPKYIKLTNEDMAVLRARALNNYVLSITREDYGRQVKLTDIAGEDIAGEIYDLILKQDNAAAVAEFNKKTCEHLGVQFVPNGEEEYEA